MAARSELPLRTLGGSAPAWHLTVSQLIHTAGRGPVYMFGLTPRKFIFHVAWKMASSPLTVRTPKMMDIELQMHIISMAGKTNSFAGVGAL